MINPFRLSLPAAAVWLAAGACGVTRSSAALTFIVHNAGTLGLPIYDHTGLIASSGTIARLGFFPDVEVVRTAVMGGLFPEVLPLFVPLGEGLAGLGSTGGRTAVGAVNPGRFTMSLTGINGTGSALPPAPNERVLEEGTRLFLLVQNASDTSWLLVSDTTWTAPREDPLNPALNQRTLALTSTSIQPGNTPGEMELFFGSYNTFPGNSLSMGVYIPEPGSALLLGMVSCAGVMRRRRR